MGCLSKSLSLLIISLLMLSVTAQSSFVGAVSAPATQWQKLYGSGVTQQVSNLIQTSDGGYVFLDSGGDYQLSFFSATLYKVDSSGNEKWNKTINQFAGANLIQTSDGGYEIYGHWSTYGTTYQFTPTLIKTDSEGNIQWVENITNALDALGFIQWYETAGAVPILANPSTTIQTSDGGFAYFELANASVFPTLKSYPTLVKTDSYNNTQWIDNFTYSGLANSNNVISARAFKIFSIIETSDGALACLGILDPNLHMQGLWGYIYLIKTEPFLPLPSPTQLPTPIPTSTPTITGSFIGNNETALGAVIIVAVIAICVGLLVYFRKGKKHTIQET
jgi:hypothetical protein